ncbi:MAG: aspartate aminotransferase family protein, partial [Gemmatimonadetes bacterium]|nr:aspartate aminotransferase family protein [Gemmatimonadota bacterium]
MDEIDSGGLRPRQDEIQPVLERVIAEASAYLAGLDDAPARRGDPDEVLRHFDEPLPETGTGALAALEDLIQHGAPALLHSGGPRNYHFVMGGTTPAALGADLLAVTYDQAAYAWLSSPLATLLEERSLEWLKQLFGLPASWTGVMTTGATMANFVALAAARQWWGERTGIDPALQGLSGAPPIPVLTSGYVHASAVKVLGLLGIGRASLQTFERDARGRVDLDALEEAFVSLHGAPAVLVANAGEVNAGDFDPIEAFADLAERYGAWLHVDGAFGLFARLSPRTRHLVEGVERADSVITDGHKWLNVPYDSGYAFVRDRGLLQRSFAYSAAYLQQPDDPRPNFGILGPESSRRARAFAVWATLKAYGREGYRTMVEHHLDLAQHLAQRVDAAPDLERLADVPLNIVCFRFNPGGLDEAALNELNRALGEAVLTDGRYFAGTTVFEGRVAL